MMRDRGMTVAVALLGLLGLAACSKNKNVDPPAELTKFQTTLQVQKQWSAGVGGAAPKLLLGLGVALDGTMVFAAGHNGDVAAFDLATGRRLWQTDTGLALTGGPGAGQGIVVAGAGHGDVVALDQATGAIKWKTRVNSEILSAPSIASDLVALRTVDGRVNALHVQDGKVAWAAEQVVPRLTLRGTGQPIVSRDLIFSGFDNGRVMGLNIKDGATAWEIAVAPPSGRTELERLVDIDSAIQVAEDDVYAVTFQGKIARLARDTGQIWWSRDVSSYRGLATDEDGVYVSTAEGTVIKIGRRTGVEMWKQEALSRRRLSAPVVVGGQVAVADLDGYVHFLNAASGALMARVGTSGDRVSAAPVASGDTLVVIDDKGHLTALKVLPPKG
jgi:outer membrane protein assembly factor BamB